MERGKGCPAQVIARARAGDAAALSDICRTYLPRLRGFFIKLGAYGDADDLTQQTLLRTIEHLSEFRQVLSGGFDGWIYRIAYNLFIDSRRRCRTQLLGDYDEPSSDASPPEIAESAELHATVQTALLGLDEEARAMVILRYYRELSYMDIARALNVSSVRVKWRLHDSLKKLEHALKEESI